MTPDGAPFLHDGARRELVTDSSIDPDVVAERGYESITRPASGTSDDHRRRLDRLGIPKWATGEDADFPGLLIPMYGPTGERVSCQWKPRRPVHNRDGKPMKYASPRGQASRLDVHPRNTARSADPTVPLWITEGVKKGDALTSRGLCVVSLTGVFNWRGQHGTLGDWEDIPLKGRTVVICFDSDARDKPNVLRAMIRLGAWLRSKGVGQVTYLITPKEHDGVPTKGVDDYFAAGGTLDELRSVAQNRPPNPDITDDTFTDARLAETLADDVLTDRYMWVNGLGWLGWDGHRWEEVTDVTVGEVIRQYTLERFRQAAETFKADSSTKPALDGWHGMLSAGRERSVLQLARGLVEHRIEQLDADPDVLNTPNGIVDLTTGMISPADPRALLTKIAGAAFVPGAEHADWKTILDAVPSDLHEWLQLRMGQAITGHMTPDDLLLVCQGGGENGKSTVFKALGDAAGSYQVLLSDRVLVADPGAHPTELMDLLGARLAMLEETPEARRLDPHRLKKTVGTPTITARRIRQDDVTFTATHTLIVATNHRPVVTDSDHGTWRRLALVRFPFTFRKPQDALAGPDDRRGDPALRGRAALDPAVWTAALAWLVEGARRWYAAGRIMPPLPARVEADTRDWRAEADHVLAYTDDRLIFDAGRHVIASELLGDVNDWLSSGGHREWSRETLAARFGGHDELRRNGVERRKGQRPNDCLSRRPVTGFAFAGDAPAQYAAWWGVRFRTAADDADQGG